MERNTLISGLAQCPTDIVWGLDEVQCMAEIAAESMQWLPLDDGAYLHVGDEDDEELVITVIGVPDVALAGACLLLNG